MVEEKDRLNRWDRKRWLSSLAMVNNNGYSIYLGWRGEAGDEVLKETGNGSVGDVGKYT